MAKGGGPTRTVNSSNASTSRTTNARNHRTGPGFTEPIKGPKEPSSSQTEIQYVYVDKLTGNQSDGYKNIDAVKTAIKRVEKKTKELELTRRTVITSKELKISKVAVAQNIGTLVNNKVEHGRKTYS